MGPFTGDASSDVANAFGELRTGVERFKAKLPEAKRGFVIETLDAAHQAYLAGDDMKGAHLLQDIHDAWFPSRFAEY